ncbi:unnamed protein product, partial [Polarella glacialis]
MLLHCGFWTAAFLRCTHVPLFQDTALTPDQLRASLAQAWRDELGFKFEPGDFTSEQADNIKAFLADHAAQAPVSQHSSITDAAEFLFTEMARNSRSGCPYFLQHSDWRVLSAKFQVNFVLHEVPGTCKPSDTNDFEPSAMQLCAQWTSKQRDHEWGHWQPHTPVASAPISDDSTCNNSSPAAATTLDGSDTLLPATMHLIPTRSCLSTATRAPPRCSVSLVRALPPQRLPGWRCARTSTSFSQSLASMCLSVFSSLSWSSRCLQESVSTAD